MNQNEQKCIEAHVEAKAEFQRFKPNATEHLKALAHSIAIKNNTNPNSELKKLTNQRRQKKNGANIRRINKKNRKGLIRKFVYTRPGCRARHNSRRQTGNGTPEQRD